MGTFKDLKERIATDYLNRFDLMAECGRAIKNSIKTYEAQRFWFNQTASATVTTASQSYFNVPSDMLSYERVEIQYSGAWQALKEVDFSFVRTMNAVSAVAVPTHFAYHGDRFELAMIPDSAYPVNVYYLQNFAALSADADSNPWTNEAANLIAHEATLEMLGSVIVSGETKQYKWHEQQLRKAMNELNLRNGMRLARRLTPTKF